MAFWRTFSWASNSFWIDGLISSDFCERPGETPPVWQKGLFRVSSLDMRCMREESGKETSWSRTFEELETFGCVRNPCSNDSSHRKLSCQRKEKVSNSLSQMEQLSWQEEIRYSAHPPYFKITLKEEWSTTVFFKESQTDLNHQTSRRMTLKPETISGVFFGSFFQSPSNSAKGQTFCDKRRVIPNTTRVY